MHKQQEQGSKEAKFSLKKGAPVWKSTSKAQYNHRAIFTTCGKLLCLPQKCFQNGECDDTSRQRVDGYLGKGSRDRKAQINVAWNILGKKKILEREETC